MYIISVVFGILVINIFSNEAKEFCADGKVNGSCVCYSTHDEHRHLVLSSADCSRIDLSVFPESGGLQPNLNDLDVSYNKIKRLERHQYVVSYNSLLLLDISHNLVDYVDNDFFEDMPNLKSLNLSYNHITSFKDADVFVKLESLEMLDLSFNRLQIIEKLFSPLKALKHLDLSYNNLHHIFTNISKPIKDILYLSDQMKDLRLDQLGIKNAESTLFKGLESVTFLSLADNQFEEVPLVPYVIEYLDLSGSGISEITAKNFNYISLKVLKLNRLENLSKIEKYSFYHLPSLEILSLTNCRRLKDFSADVFGISLFKPTSTLRKLYLFGNGFRTLSENYTLLFKQLDYLDLSNNPWKCDCSTLWFTSIRDVLWNSDIRCASPLHLMNRKLLELVDSDLPDCFPEKFGKRLHRILIPLLVALVILLSMLVIYLIYYGPSKDQPIRAVGPNSPYSQVVMDEDL